MLVLSMLAVDIYSKLIPQAYRCRVASSDVSVLLNDCGVWNVIRKSILQKYTSNFKYSASMKWQIY